MFERLGHLVYRLRFAVVTAWVVAAVAAVTLAPSLAEVGSADQTSFLPRDSEAMRAQEVLDRAFPDEASVGTVTLAFGRDGGLTDGDRAYLADTATWLTTSAPEDLRSLVTGVIGSADHPELESILRSADGELELLQVELAAPAFQPAANDAVGAIRERIAATVPAGLRAHVTGTVGIGADYLDAIVTATDRTTVATVVLVILVLLLIYRAPLAAAVPLITIGTSYVVASGVLGLLGQAGWQISSLLGTFVVVLVFGVGTDYTIFLISRFREEVPGATWGRAVARTVRRIGAVITASAATVVIGLGSMVVGQFVMFQTTGPALAIAILVTLAAGMTLTPALLAIFGRALFWPRHPQDVAAAADRGIFARLAGLIARRPGVVTVVVLVALAVPATATAGLRQSFDVLTDLPAGSDARAGFDLVAAHFDKGRLLPVIVVVDGGTGSDVTAPAGLARLRAATDALLAVPGVRRVEGLVAPSGDGSTPDGYVPSRQLAAMAERFAVPTDPAEGLRKLLDPATSDGLRAASAYVEALGAAFPEVAAASDFQAVAADLGRLPSAIDELRAGAQVSDQLARMANLLRMAATSGAPTDLWLDQVAGYLSELAVAYPQVKEHPAFQDAGAALVSSIEPPDPARLARDAEALAAMFSDRPDALLFPTTVPTSPEAQALRAEIGAVSARIPAELSAVSATFAARPDDLFLPAGLPAGDDAQAGSLARLLAAYVSAGRDVSRIYAITADDPFSAGAFGIVHGVRDALAAESGEGDGPTRILVGGQTAAQVDLQATINEDFFRVAALTVVGVLLVLVVLLRSVVAPLYLVGTVLLSYLCTLGLTSWLFQEVLGEPGLNYFLPLMVFVLLVAIGSDYNIFLMGRIREEADARGTHAGIRAASSRTGAVITSAGIILAGTFLALVSSPLSVLLQAGVIVALGVLIDTFIVRSLLVPAITTILGDAAWWPFGRGAPRGPGERPGPGARRPEPTAGVAAGSSAGSSAGSGGAPS